MKGIMAKNSWALLYNNKLTPAQGSDVNCKEIDTGGAQNGTLLIAWEGITDASDIGNFEVWTSQHSDFMVSGTQPTAVTSDGMAKIALFSDAARGDGIFTYTLLTQTAMSDLTVSSNKISAMTEDGLYVMTLKNIERYLNVAYDSPAATCTLTVIFIGHDLAESPSSAARTAY